MKDYEINKEEKQLLRAFKDLHIPPVFKWEYFEHMLFIELLDFDICTYLLEGREIIDEIYKEAEIGFKEFVVNVDVKKLDTSALEYYNYCIQVMEIYEKYSNEHKVT